MAKSWQGRTQGTGLGRLFMGEMVQREGILCMCISPPSSGADVIEPYQLRVVDVRVAAHLGNAVD